MFVTYTYGEGIYILGKARPTFESVWTGIFTILGKMGPTQQNFSKNLIPREDECLLQPTQNVKSISALLI